MRCYFANADLPQIFSRIEHTLGDLDTPFEFPKINIAHDRDHTSLLLRTDFQGLVVIKIDLLLDIRRTLHSGSFADQLNATIELLKHELGE